MTFVPLSRLFPLLTLPLLIACGGSSEPPPKTAGAVSEDGPREERSGIEASSEIGGMNEEAVEAAFSSSVSGLQRCLSRGAERVEFLGGSVSFFLKINMSAPSAIGSTDTAISRVGIGNSS